MSCIHDTSSDCSSDSTVCTPCSSIASRAPLASQSKPQSRTPSNGLRSLGGHDLGACLPCKHSHAKCPPFNPHRTFSHSRKNLRNKIELTCSEGGGSSRGGRSGACGGASERICGAKHAALSR